MLTILLLLCALVWAALLFHHLALRGLTVLLIWLLIGPVASRVLLQPSQNPFFQTPTYHEARQEGKRLLKKAFRSGEFKASDTVNLTQLLEPTRTLLLAFFLVFFLNALAKRRPLGPFNSTELWMGAFLLISLTSIFLKSYQFFYSMRIVLDAFLVPFLTYFTARRLITQEVHLRQFIQVVGYLSVYLIGIAFIERLVYSYTFYRLGGPFHDEAILYIVLTVGFLIALLDSFTSRAQTETQAVLPWGIRWIVIGFAPIVILLTWERGNWVGFLMCIWGFFLLGYRLLNFSRKIIVIGLVLTLLPILATGIQALIPEDVVEERAGNAETIYGRLATWQVTIEEGLLHPVFGIGFDNMRYILGTRILIYENVRSYISVHNSYLALFAELGVVGLSIYLAMIASIIRMGGRLYRKGPRPQDRWRGVAVIAIMVAHLTPALFASKLHLPQPWNTILIYSFMGSIAGLYSRYRFDRPYSVPAVAVPTYRQRLSSYRSDVESEKLRHTGDTMGRQS
jgi:O-antigen ligase